MVYLDSVLHALIAVCVTEWRRDNGQSKSGAKILISL